MALDKAIEEVAKSAVTAGFTMPAGVDDEPKGSFWAKFWVAMGFSTVTDKVGFLAGGLMDLNKLVGPELTLKEKLHTAIHPTKMLNKLREHAGAEYHEAAALKFESLSHFGKYALEFGKTFGKLGKNFLWGGLVTAVVGWVIGWARGERLNKASDLIHHPWRSTKIILGLEEQQIPFRNPEFQSLQPMLGGVVSPSPMQQWQERVNKPQPSHAQAVQQTKESEPLVPGM